MQTFDLVYNDLTDDKHSSVSSQSLFVSLVDTSESLALGLVSSAVESINPPVMNHHDLLKCAYEPYNAVVICRACTESQTCAGIMGVKHEP